LVVAGVGAALVAGALVGVVSTANAATTNGDPVTFGKVHCSTNLALTQDIDVGVQAVVPNNVTSGAAYTSTVPGGSATLPGASSGFNILSFQNLAQTYMFRSSGATPPTITSAVPASAQARMQGALGVTNGGVSWSAGTLSVNTGSGTTNSPDNLLDPGDPVSLTGFAPAGWNISGTVATTPTSHSFTVTGVADPGTLAPTTNGTVNTDSQIPYGVSFSNVSLKALTAQVFNTAGKGQLDYTTSAAHGLVKNQVIDITGSTPAGYNRNAAVVTAVPDATHFSVAGSPDTAYAISTITSNASGLVTVTTSATHGLATNNVVSIAGVSNAAYNVSNVTITVTSTTKFTYQLASNPGVSGVNHGNVLSPNPGASTALGSVTPVTGVTLNTPKAIPGVLTTPDVTIGITAPAGNVTITTYVPIITTSSTVTVVGTVDVVCPIPHASPQTDGISATVVGTGGPTTTGQPTCRPVTGPCDTTTSTSSTSSSSTTSTTGSSTTTTTHTTTTSTSTSTTTTSTSTTTTTTAPTTTTTTVAPTTTTSSSTTTTTHTTTTSTSTSTTTTSTSTTTTSTPTSTTTSTTAPTTTTTTTAPTSTTSTTTAPTSTTSTTIPSGGTPTCDVGTGPLKNPPGATFKASPGLLVTPSATKKTNFTITAALTNCTNFGDFVTKYPVTAGKLKITVQLPPGSTCDNVQPGFPIKSSITVTFQGINPKTGKLATASSAVKSTLASYAQTSAAPLAVDIVGQPFAKTTSPFFTKVANVHLTIDEDAAARATLCAAKGGLKVMHLNNGPGSFTLS